MTSMVWRQTIDLWQPPLLASMIASSLLQHLTSKYSTGKDSTGKDLTHKESISMPWPARQCTRTSTKMISQEDSTDETCQENGRGWMQDSIGKAFQQELQQLRPFFASGVCQRKRHWWRSQQTTSIVQQDANSGQHDQRTLMYGCRDLDIYKYYYKGYT